MKKPKKREPELFLNRELSWLEFNGRVLEEACDPANPLLERLKFLCIVSTNLDEFFEIRVSGLQQRQEKLVESQRQLAAMADQQTLLFQELQHRVANNLASVSSMLRIQRRQIERAPETALAVPSPRPM